MKALLIISTPGTEAPAVSGDIIIAIVIDYGSRRLDPG